MQRGRRRITVAAPTVVAPDAPTLTAPADESDVYPGVAVTVSATVTAGQVPDRVDFVLDPGGGEEVIATDSASPFSQSWTPTEAQLGAHTLVARFVYGSGSVDSTAIDLTCVRTEGMVLWLKGDDGVTIDTGVSLWEDQSTGGHDFVQAVGANQPVVVAAAAAYNGHDVLDFNGTTHAMTCAGAAAAVFPKTGTFFLVTDEDAIDTASGTAYLNDAWLAASDGNCSLGLKSTPIAFYARYFTPSGSVLVTKSISLATPKLITIQSTGDAGTVTIWKNGAGAVTDALATQDGPTGNAMLGTNYNGTLFVNGRVAEILVSNVELTTEQRQAVESYLMTKFGIV